MLVNMIGTKIRAKASHPSASAPRTANAPLTMKSRLPRSWVLSHTSSLLRVYGVLIPMNQFSFAPLSTTPIPTNSAPIAGASILMKLNLQPRFHAKLSP